MNKQKTKSKLTKRTGYQVYKSTMWRVFHGELVRGKGRPPAIAHLFQVVGEKLPVACLKKVKADMRENEHNMHGIYVAHDSMGCPRYIGRGNIFQRLDSRIKAQKLEIKYFSFYVVSQKKHEREIETLLIRAVSFLLEFNDRKKRIGILPGNIKDFEAGTYFYERQYKKGPRKVSARSRRISKDKRK